MKILMFGWEFPPFISGGLGTACFGLTQGLIQKDAEVVFVVPRMIGRVKKSRVRLIDGAGIRISDDTAVGLLERMRIKPIDSFLIPYMTEESYEKTLQTTIESLKKNRRLRGKTSWQHYGPDLHSEVFRYARIARIIANREECDVIHVHDWMTIPAGIEAKHVTGKPLVVHIHALETDRSTTRIDERIYGIERFGMIEADHVMAVSHYTKRKIVQQYGIPHEKISVIHNAVSHSESRRRYHIRKDPAKKYVLFLGRITSQKGPDYFLKAARKVLSKNRTVHFIMAGSGDMMSQVKEEVTRVGIDKNVIFTGFLRGADVERAYAMSDLYVMPSVSEPFGITALEAIMYDVPVIISNQSGVSEVISNCPRVDFWNTDELADNILNILEDDMLRDEIVRSCRKELKDVSWKIAAEKIIRVYRELIMV
jgi:glycogen(starch) synthase